MLVLYRGNGPLEKRIRVPAEQSVLDAILAAGVEMPYSCKTGECKVAQ